MLGQQGRFVRRLIDWYAKNRRALPWRVGLNDLPDPYHVLVSEAMLQQTQVATVVGYFDRFLKKFPTLSALADSDEQQALLLWQGLGYYSRARNLRRAAQQIVERFAGKVPNRIEDLLSLPGVGRYSAGAIASTAYGIKAPILDGNVARVICRLDLIRQNPRDGKTLQYLWKRAEELLPSAMPGTFNSAMMELGATICTPRNPDCPRCPVRLHCAARAANLQNNVPVPRAKRITPLEKRITLCIRRNNTWLIEQRPSTGRWASLWQFPTFSAPLNLPPSLHKHLCKLGTIRHSLTHRKYEFQISLCQKFPDSDRSLLLPSESNSASRTRQWVRFDELKNYPMSRPQLQIGELLGKHCKLIP